jgi:hypothetical protein
MLDEQHAQGIDLEVPRDRGSDVPRTAAHGYAAAGHIGDDHDDGPQVCYAPEGLPGEVVYPQPALAARQLELAAEAFPAVNAVVDEHGCS